MRVSESGNFLRVSSRGDVLLQISQPPGSASSTFPELLMNGCEEDSNDHHVREQSHEKVSSLSLGAHAQGLETLRPTRPDAERGKQAPPHVSSYLLLQLCLQLTDELIFALQGLQQFLVLLVQATRGVHILQTGQLDLLFHHTHLKSINKSS